MTSIISATCNAMFDKLRHEDENGEFWWARELAEPLGYTWRRFTDAIERARIAIDVNGEEPDIHIHGWTQPSNQGRGAGATRTDYRVTRYGAYAIIQGGDPRKPEIAAGWAYFRVKTREAEVKEKLTPAGMLMEMAQQFLAQERWNAMIEHRQGKTELKLSNVEDEVANLKAITPLIHGVGDSSLLTIRDAAHAVTGTDMGQNNFAKWLTEAGILFRDHNNALRCKQDWITHELAQESYEAWNNGKGWSWVTRFTSRGLAKIKQTYAEYNEQVKRMDDENKRAFIENLELDETHRTLMQQ